MTCSIIMAENIVIEKGTAKRLIKDIKQMASDQIDGIHYMHDTTNILQGSALIIGPPDTPYEGGYFLFLFDFPTNYPFSPPVLTYYTNDGHTRMHPNLYKTGKVCLSILNTWNGESWTGCQTISSVLLTIRSIMTNDPILHEPGIDKSHRDFHTYTEIIRYKSIETGTLNVINSGKYDRHFKELVTIAEKDFVDNYDKRLAYVKNASQLFIESENNIRRNKGLLYTAIYNIKCKVDYAEIINEMEITKINLLKKLKI